MARPWAEVAADPNFQALAPDAQENARNAYFQQNVLPNIPAGVNPGAIRIKFDQDTVPTLKSAAPQSGLEHLKQLGGIITQDPLTAGPRIGLGMLENAVQGTGSAVAKLAGRAVDLATGSPNTRAQSWEQATSQYLQPGATGQQLQQLGSQEASKVGGAINQIPGANTPLGQTLKEAIPEAATDVGLLFGARAGGQEFNRAIHRQVAPVPSAQAIVSRLAAQSPQNVGAATAAARISSASPELQQAVVRAAQRTGGAVNPEALGRHLDAESLPVPVRLTEGEATQDPTLISEEKNARGVHEDLANHAASANKALVENLTAIRDQVGPDVFSTNAVEHGDTLIGAYQAKDAAVSKVIDSAYDTARNAVPEKTASVMNAPQLLADVTRNLHENLLFDSAPQDVMRTLGRLSDNNSMTFGNIENLRTNLARIVRSHTVDGNTRYAAGIIRDTLEQAPLSIEDAAVKASFDQARTLARARFQALEADPAYKAAVYGTVEPDKFVRRFVLNGNRDEVATMQKNLADNPTALQTNSVAVLDHLRQASVDNNGRFIPARFNKALAALDPKLRSLIDPKTVEQLETLGRVGTYVKGQPEGSFVANSNTPIALANMVKSAGMDIATGMLPFPAKVAVKGARYLMGRASDKRYVSRVTAPGAGIDRLSTPTPVQTMIDAARRKAESGTNPYAQTGVP